MVSCFAVQIQPNSTQWSSQALYELAMPKTDRFHFKMDFALCRE
jgi:hypothetical protein